MHYLSRWTSNIQRRLHRLHLRILLKNNTLYFFLFSFSKLFHFSTCLSINLRLNRQALQCSLLWQVCTNFFPNWTTVKQEVSETFVNTFPALGPKRNCKFFCIFCSIEPKAVNTNNFSALTLLLCKNMLTQAYFVTSQVKIDISHELHY